MTDNKNYSINILNLVGQQINRTSIADIQVELDIANLSQGVYLYQIIDDDGNKAIGKFVKE